MKYIHTKSNLELENKYPKLVRDKILEIIEKRTGKLPKYRSMGSKAEYDKYLRLKVGEEAQELLAAKGRAHTAEELADIMELIDMIVEINKLTMKDIRTVQKEKVKERGGFRKKILMLKKAK